MARIDPKTWNRWCTDAAGACACLVITLVAYFAGFAPLRWSRAGLAAKQSRLHSQSRRLSRLQSSTAALKGRVAEVEQALAESELRLDAADQVNGRVARLTELAGASGLKIDDVRLGESRRERRYTAFPITLAGSGSYGTCLVFLRQLNQTFADTAVTAFDLSARPTAPAAANFRFELLWYAAPPLGDDESNS